MTSWSAKVARVDQPEPGLLSISLRWEGRTEVLLVTALPGALALGLTPDRPRGASANETVTKLRRHVESATLIEVEQSKRAVRLTFERSGSRRFLVAAPAKPHGAWWLRDPDGAPVLRSPGAPKEPPSEDEHWVASSADALRALGAQALAVHRDARKQQLERALRRHEKRLRKKREAITADLRRASMADELRRDASLLLAHAAQIEPGATHFETTTWDDPPERIRLELDPQKRPQELAESWFARSKRMKRGLEIAPERLEAVDRELAVLEALRNRLADSPTRALASALHELGVEVSEPKERVRAQRQSGARRPYRTFVAQDGSSVLVGRGAADNDRLTMTTARPHDLWLHARGVAGAHVVVRLTKGKDCTAEALVDAATLAAHFSDLRGEPVVEVIYTPRRYVRKRKGSPAGSVTLERERGMAVRVEPGRLERLLRSERKSP